MLTNSAREVINTFGAQIIEIEAEASLDTWNRDELMRDYGVMRHQLTRQKVSIDYHEIRNEHGPENPITDAKAEKILAKIDDHLDDFSIDDSADLAVSKLRLRVSVEEIEDGTRAQSDEFELTFISDPAGDAREITERKNAPHLYEDLGFEYRNLNLRSVAEVRAKYTEQSDAKLMGWGGPTDVRPRCSNELAQAVHSNILPEKFAALKWYTVGEENTTQLQSIETADGDQA